MGVVSLYDELNAAGVNFYLWDLGNDKATIIEMNGRYGVFMDFDNIATEAEENVVVAHEGGHAMTGSTHALNSPYDVVEQHENRADKWAITKLIPKIDLDQAVKAGHTEIWDLADLFNVTEPFMRKAAWWYTYGNLAVESI